MALFDSVKTGRKDRSCLKNLPLVGVNAVRILPFMSISIHGCLLYIEDVFSVSHPLHLRMGGDKKHVYWAALQLIHSPITEKHF